jgi:lipopolysaccharide/colanic/teichoic acid biosynthesis glycosyltransferase
MDILKNRKKNKLKRFNIEIEREMALSRRGGYCFCVMLVELKNKNNTSKVENKIKKRIRSYDLCERFDDGMIGVILKRIENDKAFTMQKVMQSINPEMDVRCYVYPNKDKSQKSVEEIKFYIRDKMPLSKRVVDVIMASLILTVFLPLGVLIVLLIKISSPGPIFFKQERIGIFQEKFMMYKFRTMKYKNNDEDHVRYLKKIINDSKKNEKELKDMKKMDDYERIYPFGRFLRKYCLDEIPQLYNVLKGDMSIVGPRPPIDYEVEEYEEWYKERFDSYPGLTGLWQVSGKNRLDFEKMIKLDIAYKKNYKLCNDFRIMLKTPVVIFKQHI